MTILTYDFFVFAANGPLAFTPAAGNFSIDAASIPADGSPLPFQGGLAGFDFSWDGVAYTPATAHLNNISFRPPSSLGFLDIAHLSGGSLTPGQEGWAVNYDTMLRNDPCCTNFFYTVAGDTHFYNGTLALNGPFASVNAAEPAALALFAAGLVCLGLVRRRFGQRVLERAMKSAVSFSRYWCIAS